MRPANQVKKELATGEIEVAASEINVMTRAAPLPLELDEGVASKEDIRLQYRYLDLRRPKMIKNLTLRHKAIQFIRDYLNKQGFLEITTPILTKSTPEGARDYLVPSRVHKGKFYALPQSPQQYKQLLMVAGADKYFQIAPCFRDEDARADRCPGEFYQLDLEMSFVEQEDILNLTENLFIEMVKKVFPDKKITQIPFPRLSHAEAMEKYKTDSPDLRKNKQDKNELAFCWVVDFPLFTKQTEEDFFHEVGGGSIRIHNPDIQAKIFDLIGFTDKQKKEFAHLLEAFTYGVPPHGGIAPGLDRLLMVVMGEDSIREVIAFPKDKAARDPVMDAPSEVTQEQLDELGLKLDKK